MSKKIDKVASLSIKQPGKMTDVERRDVAGWLRWQASQLSKHSKNYTDSRFTAGFNYVR